MYADMVCRAFGHKDSLANLAAWRGKTEKWLSQKRKDRKECMWLAPSGVRCLLGAEHCELNVPVIALYSSPPGSAGLHELPRLQQSDKRNPPGGPRSLVAAIVNGRDKARPSRERSSK